MSTLAIPRATLDDLYRAEGKAELIDGRIVSMASGYLPIVVAGNIFADLRSYQKSCKKGYVLGDNLGYAVSEMLSGRESFSPDVSYYDGPLPKNLMRFIEGPPTCAIEIRSENDYGDAAEELLAAKRNDYFLAGTLAVWDVDPQAETIRLYVAASPNNPTLFRRGEIAHAEPAVPGWRISVDEVFAR